MIRTATENDVERISELLKQVQAIHAQGRPDLFKSGAQKYSPEELREILRDPDRPIFVHVDEEGTVDGYAFCVCRRSPESSTLAAHNTLYVDDLCVDACRRGGHIGTALFAYVRDVGKKMGFDSVTLNVWSLNESALRFYEKCGLHPLKTTMEYRLKG